LDTVSLKVPASPEYLQVVRLMAAGLAARLAFTLEDIEDLKIAVDEMCAYLTGTHGREGSLEVRYEIHDDRLEIRGVGRFAPGHKVRTELTEFSRMILTTVVDSAALALADGVPTFSLAKSKPR
jgi:anti-sigma regulatory factor (Ser/Thr protein kinase)